MQVLTDKTINLLFGTFPREVAEKPDGNFQRRLIYSTEQFIDYIERNNGINTQVFSSVYSLDFTIDKAFIDIDGSLDYQKALCRYLSSEQIPYIPIASGKKGFHTYIILKPKQYQNPKELLYSVTMYILEQTFGKQELTNLIQNDIIDSHLIGNIRGMCRIPNTLRSPLNLTYCTYLPNNFLFMTEQDISHHIKQPHFYDYHINIQNCPTLEDLAKKYNIKIDEYNHQNNNGNGNLSKLSTNIANIKNIHTYLEKLLRPCLYYNLITTNPKHKFRVVATIDLLQFLQPKQIMEIYSRLKWLDFNEHETLYQIEKCSHYKPYGCKKLREKKIPIVCCEY